MKLLKKAFCFITAAVILTSVSLLPVGAVSSAPYKGYTYDIEGNDIDAPVGYVPDKTYVYRDLGLKDNFSRVNDIFNYNNERLYICDSHKFDESDTGVKDRVIVLDSNMKYVREYTEFVAEDGKKYPLTNPVGVYVTDDEIFVCCDIQIERVDEEGEDDSYYDGYCVAADYDGNVTRVFTNPSETSTIVDSESFRPFDVVEDNSGYIYIRVQDVLEGLMVFDENGEFLQFYGANEVKLTWFIIAQQFWKKLFNSRDQIDSMIRAVPTEMSSIFVDKEGFIYTSTSQGVESDLMVRKLNASGSNILQSDSTVTLETVFGDRTELQEDASILVDVHVDENNIIAVLDQSRGRVFLYDQKSTLLTTFGLIETDPLIRNGTTVLPVALTKLNDRYLILDQTQKAIVTYKPTEFIGKLMTANYYYMRGWYIDGQPYWEDVLKYDANNIRAYSAIGKSLLEQEKYEEALYYLEKGSDRTSYSTAYAEYRREYIRQNYWWLIPLIIVGIVAIVYLFKLIRRLLGFKDKKRRIKFS